MSTSVSQSHHFLGEIVEVTSTSFCAQCFNPRRSDPPCLIDPPDFGSFVKIGQAPGSIDSSPVSSEMVDDEADPFENMGVPKKPVVMDAGWTLAVVTHARMTALDAGRRPMALGYDDPEQIRHEQPQIFELLTTEFDGALIGFTDDKGHLRRYLPPKPPRLHRRVYACTSAEILAITADLQFLQPMLSSGRVPGGSDVPIEELVAAILRSGLSARDGDPAYLRLAGTTVAAMLGADYNRLQAIMRSVAG